MKQIEILNEENKYIPGTCNIGKKEINRRRQSTIISLIVSLLLIVFFQVLPVNHEWRLLLFFPVTSAVIGILQVRQKFCVAFGMKGIFNFGDVGKTFSVDQEDYLKTDRIKARQMIAAGIFTGLIVSLVYFFLPI